MKYNKKFKVSIKPLSVNKLWQGRRFKTKDYKSYSHAVLLLLKNYKEKHTGYVGIELEWHIKNFKLSDEANFLKAFLDLIVKAGIIEDDRFIKWHRSEKFFSKDQFITFRIIELDNDV